jgi:hypothetical protein
MMPKQFAVLALVALLALPVIAHAHGGHTHKVMGTVSKVQGTQVEVKGTDGKVVMVVLDARTAITRGKTKAEASALKAGERVSIDYTQDKNINTAKTIKLGETSAPAKK